MKIKSVVAYLEKFPLAQPYTISYQKITDTEIIFLEIELENGIIGFGASNPFPEVVGETPTLTLKHLQSDFVNAFVGKDIEYFQTLIDTSNNHFVHMPGTLAAIDIALHDAFGKLHQVSVVNMYGRKIEALPTSITIGIKDTEEMLDEADRYFKNGFRILKIKTGINVEEDIERILKLYEKFRNKIKLRVDANLGYLMADLKKFYIATQDLNIELIEQPLKVDENNKLLQLSEKMRKIIVADESLIDMKAAVELVKEPIPFGVWNVKLMKAGGIKNAKKIANIAGRNVELFWGCNDESMISISAALHIAYACEHTKYLDLDGNFDVLEEKFSSGFFVSDGYMYLKDSIGIGIQKMK